jgi:arylsulfatase A-like enzyme
MKLYCRPASQAKTLRKIGFALISLFCAVSLSAAPNVLLILTDNQSYHELGCHGHELVKTPHIDSLAEESVDFTNFHAPPYCSPSRGLLLTGRYALRLGIHNTVGGVSILHKDEKTLADLLGKAGYATGVFGKWHLGMSYPYSPRFRGFQKTFIHGGGGIGQLEDYFGNNHLDATYWENGKEIKTEGFSTDVLFGQATKFIDQYKKKPFFCFISTPATHKPWQSHPEVAQRITNRDGASKTLPLLSMIENIDDNVGKILQHLEELGLRENTLVILATDQGMTNRGAPENSPENPPSKSFDSRHHVFCMMRYPSLTKKPGRSDALAGMVDVAPTILDLCGVAIPDDLDGRSLKPLLSGEGRWKDPRHLIVQCPRGRERKKWHNASVKTQRWRLVNGEKLYDLENGDAEVTAKHPEVVKELTAKYEKFWNSLPPVNETLSRHLLGVQDTRLNGMDWYQGGHPWNTSHFKRLSSGTWAVEVARKGRYRFELSHYPREAKKAIGATGVTLLIGDNKKVSKLNKDTKSVVIELDLEPGNYDMTGTFSNEKETWGTYFAYVSRVD